jgi:hypothetical protein
MGVPEVLGMEPIGQFTDGGCKVLVKVFIYLMIIER